MRIWRDRSCEEILMGSARTGREETGDGHETYRLYIIQGRDSVFLY